MWQLLNWVFVVQYWSLLYDVGQIQPTLYPRLSVNPSFSQETEYSDSNNIFVNDTLFEIFTSYFRGIIIPLINVVNLDGITYPTEGWGFQALDSANRLEPREVAFNVAYSCTTEQLKKPLSLIISVIVADYTFINPVFGFIVLFGAWYMKRKHKNKEPDDCNSNWLRVLIVANWCEGCAEKEKGKGNGAHEQQSRLLNKVD